MFLVIDSGSILSPPVTVPALGVFSLYVPPYFELPSTYVKPLGNMSVM